MQIIALEMTLHCKNVRVRVCVFVHMCYERKRCTCSLQEKVAGEKGCLDKVYGTK